MASGLKGNLGLKSSPLAPTACKLSTQHLVLDHMDNHYRKIAKAKPAIDNKPPRTLTTSQKMRDRKQRNNALKGQAVRPVSSLSYNDQKHLYQDFLDDEPEDEESRLVQSIMRSTLGIKEHQSNDATYGSSSQTATYTQDGRITKDTRPSRPSSRNMARTYPPTSSRPGSARSVRSTNSMMSSTSRVPINSHDPTKITYNGDVLDKRAHVFTEGGEFTPRTLRTNHVSRLKNSQCYNPPKRSKSSQQQGDVEDMSTSQKGQTYSQQRPKPQPRGCRRSVDKPAETYNTDNLETGQLTETQLMDITLQSRDGRHGREADQDVPRLAISMDKDHMNWLREQASKAQYRTNGEVQVRSALQENHPSASEANRIERAGYEHGSDVRRSIKMANKEKESPIVRTQRSLSSLSVVSQSPSSSWISQLIIEEEEEQKYLNFAKEVTDDVITRGICSDKVLHRVFENHIDRRKGDLDEERMRTVIKDLRKDLGLRDSSLERPSYGNTNYNHKANETENSSLQSNGRRSKSPETALETGDTSSFMAPRNGMTSNSENDTSLTMESTSTMKFGRTTDVFSTIHSVGTVEEEGRSNREKEGGGESGDGDELSATQALRQYQFNLTVKEAGGEISESAVGSESNVQNGGSLLDTGDQSFQDRPATGELRSTQEDESLSEVQSEASTLKGTNDDMPIPSPAESLRRAKRRERLQRNSQGIENLAQPVEQSSSAQSEDTTRSTADIDDGEASVVSSASGSQSQRPAIRPRAKRRQQQHGGDSSGQMEKSYGQATAMIEKKTGEDDTLSSSAPGDSGVASGGGVAENCCHDDTLEDVGKDENKHPHQQHAGKEEEEEDYDDDYEDDYDGDDDDGHGASTHRTSDDDF